MNQVELRLRALEAASSWFVGYDHRPGSEFWHLVDTFVDYANMGQSQGQVSTLELLSSLEKQGVELMTTVAEIKQSLADTLTKISTMSSVDDSIAAIVTEIRAQNVDLKAKLDAAIAAGAASGAVSPQDLQDISDGLGAVNSALDADAIKEAAVAGTPAAPPLP